MALGKVQHNNLTGLLEEYIWREVYSVFMCVYVCEGIAHMSWIICGLYDMYC